MKKQWLRKPHIASAGTCCLVGIISNGMVYIANSGDSRVVLGRLERATREISAIQLSTEHNVNLERVRDELRSKHPYDSQIVVMRHNVWRVKGLIQVKNAFFLLNNTNLYVQTSNAFFCLNQKHLGENHSSIPAKYTCGELNSYNQQPKH